MATSTSTACSTKTAGDLRPDEVAARRAAPRLMPARAARHLGAERLTGQPRRAGRSPRLPAPCPDLR